MKKDETIGYRMECSFQEMLDALELAQGARVLIALSGGPDSVALAFAAYQWHRKGRVSVYLCHLNHQLRGQDSDDDEQWVREFAATYDLTCLVKRQAVGEIAMAKGMNEEAVGRECRYAWFREAADEIGAEVVFLAHHANDQAETILWRMIRGTGMDGLSGMLSVREDHGIRYARPFLQWTKNELLAYCEHHQLTYRLDESNQNLRYTRNSIRHEVMPLLQRYNPNVVHQFGQMAQIVAEEEEWMSKLTADWASLHIEFQNDNKHASWSRSEFIALPIALQRRVIKLILNYLSLHNETFSFIRIESLRNLINQEDSPNQVGVLSEREQLRRSYDRIEAGRFPDRSIDSYEYNWNPLQEPELYIPECSGYFTATRFDHEQLAEEMCRQDGAAVFAAGMETFQSPIIVRNRRSGDRMVWFADGRHKKIQDIWVDAKWPAHRRANWPLLLIGNEIVWIPGFRHASDRKNPFRQQQVVIIRWHTDG